MVITDEIATLFRRFRSDVGAPIVEAEITDQQLCDELAMSIEDYAEKVQNWVIENNWANFYGKKVSNISNMDLAYALSVRTIDMSRDYSYWFSRDTGLQQRGPWELKKDYIVIETGKQDYIIPAGREVNKVMWCNPATSQAALYANYGGLDMLGFAGGYGQAGGGSYGPIGGFYIGQSYDVAYMAADLQYKNRLIRGDLTYEITAGPNGTRILHLFSTPGSKLTFGNVYNPLGGISLVGCEVWYTYYDTTIENADQCRRENDTVILTPDQIPLRTMEYGLLNDPTKTIVRKIFFARAKRALANARGKFSGKISIMEAEAQLDYTMLVSQADKELDDVMNSLKERLERMSPYSVMEKNAKLTEDLTKILAAKPLTIMVC
jgi:hypothetical protein